jgi:hypothetical protein
MRHKSETAYTKATLLVRTINATKIKALKKENNMGMSQTTKIYRHFTILISLNNFTYGGFHTIN